MDNFRAPMPILMAEDDPDDRMLARDALEQCRVTNRLIFVEDGEELMEYLRRNGRYAGKSAREVPRPGLILLDLNMPRKNGREALKEIKSDRHLHQIPVIILTTSRNEDDIRAAYEDGVNSYIAKPITFDGLIDVMKSLKHYWFDIVAMPETDAFDVSNTQKVATDSFSPEI